MKTKTIVLIGALASLTVLLTRCPWDPRYGRNFWDPRESKRDDKSPLNARYDNSPWDPRYKNNATSEKK